MSRGQRWQHILDRDWNVVRDAWLGSLPVATTAGARPEPSLATLGTLHGILLTSKSGDVIPDVGGLRSCALAEAIFLIHKGLHVLRAAQAHGMTGMPSWTLFSAYHSAYLNAKGLMAMLGVAIPQLEGRQVVLDLFPQPEPKHIRRRRAATGRFSTFKLLFSDRIDQRYFWELFLRVLRLANVEIWNPRVIENIRALNSDTISPPRNRFIYNSSFWPFDDLFDVAPPAILLKGLQQPELDVDSSAFLLELGCSVASLAESLLIDLAEVAPSIASEVVRGGYRAVDWAERNPLYDVFISTHGIHR